MLAGDSASIAGWWTRVLARDSGSPARSRRSNALASLRSNSRLGLAGSWRTDMVPPFVMALVRVRGPKRGYPEWIGVWRPASDGTIPSRGPEALRRRLDIMP